MVTLKKKKKAQTSMPIYMTSGKYSQEAIMFYCVKH